MHISKIGLNIKTNLGAGKRVETRQPEFDHREPHNERNLPTPTVLLL